MPQKKIIKVLSIDGGGIYGLTSAVILSEIERITQKSISSLFDLIAGTSTGGILALGLTKPAKDGQPFYKASDGIDLYTNKAKNIFSRPFFYKLFALGNILNAKYPAESRDKTLSLYFEDSVLSDSLTNVIIPAYDIEKKTTYFFKSMKANFDKNRDFYMRDVARATSAAPTFLKPVLISNLDNSKSYALIDGGVFANNPALCAYTEALTIFPDHDQIIMVSLGVSGNQKPYPFNKAKNWGILGWAIPLLDILFDGAGDTVAYGLNNIFPEADIKNKHYRLEVPLPSLVGEFDDASEKNTKLLKTTAENYIHKNKELIEKICKQITS